MMIIPVAISLGFLGSFHCMGMCGPIALALPLNRKNYFTILAGSTAYNLGRVVTYSLIGLVFGLIGQGLFIAGFQNILSVSLGVLILLSLVLSARWTSGLKWGVKIQQFISPVKHKIAQLFNRKSNGALFLIGTLNGLLPCGLVYIAITASIATGSAANGALFMAFFGLGTLPTMLFINVISGSVSMNFRNKVRKIVPVVVGVMALGLILRGLNLGIPYVSPRMTEKKIEILDEQGRKKIENICVHDCCKK